MEWEQSVSKTIVNNTSSSIKMASAKNAQVLISKLQENASRLTETRLIWLTHLIRIQTLLTTVMFI